MPPVGFELTIPASQQPQNRAVTGISNTSGNCTFPLKQECFTIADNFISLWPKKGWEMGFDSQQEKRLSLFRDV
jgi:hypothetical protein